MRRLAIVFGYAVFAWSPSADVSAQQPIEPPVFSSPAHSTQPLHAPQAMPMDGSQAAFGPAYGNPVHGGTVHGGPVHGGPVHGNHAASGNCGCPACTQQPSECWTIFYRNTRWPAPFQTQDINAVTSYFAVQRENGWKMHNTVGHVLFDPKTNGLTEAGKNHIRSILTDNPADRRVVFVLQGQTPQHTAQRIESVQLAISALVPTGELPAIYVTDRDAPGSSGAYQTAVTRAMMTSLPAPRLPSFNAVQGNP